MNTMDTKEKILNVAEQFFAERGYSGTSIRDISTEAQVNVSAINYHFSNKQTLYWSVFLRAHWWFEDVVKAQAKQNKSVRNLFCDLHSEFYESSKKLKNGFMILLSNHIPEMEAEIFEQLGKKDEPGPPGSAYLMEALTKELDVDVSQETKQWAINTIISDIIHWVLMMSSSVCRDIYGEERPEFSTEYRLKSLGYHVDSVIEFIKKNPKAF